jgi:hypothetical protein
VIVKPTLISLGGSRGVVLTMHEVPRTLPVRPFEGGLSGGRPEGA